MLSEKLSKGQASDSILENSSKQNFAQRRAFKGGVKQSVVSVRMCPRAASALTQSRSVVGTAAEAVEVVEDFQ